MKSLRSHLSITMILLGVLCLAVLTLSPRAEAFEPENGIVAINAKTGMVTGFDPTNGLKFEFKVKSAKLLKTLKIGQAVKLNARTKSVSVKGLPKNCCTRVKILAGPASTSATTGSANAIAVARSFRAALGNPAVRSAVSQGIRQQLRTRRPIAFVKGHWVSIVDLSRVYGNATVRAAMLAGLAGNPVAGQLANLGRGNLEARLGVVFTPSQLGSLVLGDMTTDIMASAALQAFQTHATDIFGVDDAIVIAFVVGVAASAVVAIADHYLNDPSGPIDGHTGLPIDDPDADPDGDGTPNRLDGDDDGDGTSDDSDSYPYDPKESICGGSISTCGSGVAVAFTNVQSQTIMAAILTTLTSRGAPGIVSVSPSVGGMAGMSVVFPAAFH